MPAQPKPKKSDFVKRKQVLKEINKVLKQGHGGGNWRRLIIALEERIKNL